MSSPPQIPLAGVNFLSTGLMRPECVLCTAGGDIFTADGRGGVARSRTFGPHDLYLPVVAGTDRLKGPILPNGIALQRDGSFLVTNVNDAGGLYRLDRDGRLNDVLHKVGGIDLPATNFVLIDDRGRVWLTVSTRQVPRSLGYRQDIADGFIVLIDGKGARIVADGLGYTNEIQLDRRGEHVYVAETFARRLTRFRINRYGELSERTVITEFGAGTFPDGLAVDVEEHLWVTSPVSNRVIRVAPDGAQTLMLEDTDPAHLATVEAAYADGTMGYAHLSEGRGRKLRNISSLAFGGRDLRTAILGCLSGERLAYFRSPVIGRPPVHWHYNI
ncbi:MAG: SMP-30/gluconolactonase/LRE family protein [Kiloniellaceae bacterium]